MSNWQRVITVTNHAFTNQEKRILSPHTILILIKLQLIWYTSKNSNEHSRSNHDYRCFNQLIVLTTPLLKSVFI